MVNGNIRPYLEEIPEEARVHDWWMALICAAMGKISFLDKETLYYRSLIHIWDLPLLLLVRLRSG